MDLQHKEDEDVILQGEASQRKALSGNQKEVKALTYQEVTDDELERRETSTRDSVLKIQDWKREQYKKKFEAQKKDDEGK